MKKLASQLLLVLLAALGFLGALAYLTSCAVFKAIEPDAVALGADTCEAAADAGADPWVVDLVCLTTAGARAAVKMPAPEWAQIKASKASVRARPSPAAAPLFGALHDGGAP